MDCRQIVKIDSNVSFKCNGRQYFCYSASKLKKVCPDAYIIGEARAQSNKEKNSATVPSSKLYLGQDWFAEFPYGTNSRIKYKVKGYVEVGLKSYVAILESRKPTFIAVAGVFMIAAIAACAMAMLLPRGGSAPSTPMKEDVPALVGMPDIDPHSIAIQVGDTPIAIPSNLPENGGSVDMQFKTSAKLTLASGDIKMKYVNPITSSHAVVLELYVLSNDGSEEYLIATSGLIPAGATLERMTLDQNTVNFKGEGKYNARYHVKYYNTETGEQATLVSTLDDITLSVRNK